MKQRLSYLSSSPMQSTSKRRASAILGAKLQMPQSKFREKNNSTIQSYHLPTAKSPSIDKDTETEDNNSLILNPDIVDTNTPNLEFDLSLDLNSPFSQNSSDPYGEIVTTKLTTDQITSEPSDQINIENDAHDLFENDPYKNTENLNADNGINETPPLPNIKEDNFNDIFHQKILTCQCLLKFPITGIASFRQKQTKMNTLMDILTFFESHDARNINRALQDEVLDMIELNIFQQDPILAVKRFRYSYPTDLVNPAWSHLSIVYSILNRFLKVFPNHKRLNFTFVKKILKCMNSPDVNERVNLSAFLKSYFAIHQSEVTEIIGAIKNQLIDIIDHESIPYSAVPLLTFLSYAVTNLKSPLPDYFIDVIKHSIPLIISPDFNIFQLQLLHFYEVALTSSYPDLIKTTLDYLYFCWPRNCATKQLGFIQIMITLVGRLFTFCSNSSPSVFSGTNSHSNSGSSTNTFGNGNSSSFSPSKHYSLNSQKKAIINQSFTSLSKPLNSCSTFNGISNLNNHLSSTNLGNNQGNLRLPSTNTLSSSYNSSSFCGASSILNSKTKPVNNYHKDYHSEMMNSIKRIFVFFSQCIRSPNEKAVEPILKMWNSNKTDPFILAHPKFSITVMYESVEWASENHWSANIKELAKNSLAEMKKLNMTAFLQMKKVSRENDSKKLAQAQAQTGHFLKSWATISHAAAANDGQIDVLSFLKIVQKQYTEILETDADIPNVTVNDIDIQMMTNTTSKLPALRASSKFF